MPENSPMILVTGATGDVGGALVHSLSGAGVAFRVMCRRQEQVTAFADRGIEAVLGDLRDPASLRDALAGCEQLFLLPPHHP